MGELPLRVVTHRNWLARLFTPYGGVQDFGMDVCPEEVLSYASVSYTHLTLPTIYSV